MSVVSSRRNEGQLQVLNLMRELCEYSIIKTSNEKYFPKSKRWLFAQPISQKAMQALALMRSANSIFPKTQEDYLARHRRQISAHALLNEMISYIDMVHTMGHLDNETISKWIEKIVDTDILLNKWIKSDEKKYGNLE